MLDTRIDDGSGTIQAWRIENFEKVKIDDIQVGQFYDGDSYIILYTYKIPPSTTDQHISYFWQGRYSTTDEKGTSAILTRELDEEMESKPVHVRVTQGKEPSHFRSIFRAPMIIHSGGVASGFRNVDKADNENPDTDGFRLYLVRGTRADNTYGFAISEKASSLNSAACLVVSTGTNIASVWKGSRCDDFEYEAALEIAQILSSDSDHTEISTVNEGDESDEFWSALGGKGEYASLKPEEEAPSDPRLFHVTDAYTGTGVTNVTEISKPFTQVDLVYDDVMILDVGTTIYVWIGLGANDDEIKHSHTHAQQYMLQSEHDNERNKDATIVTVRADSEPIIFTQFFNWDPELKNKLAYTDPLEDKVVENVVETIDETDHSRSMGEKSKSFWEKKDSTVGVSMAWEEMTPGKDTRYENQHKDIDYEKLHESMIKKDAGLGDVLNGTVKMWRIEDFKKVPVDDDAIGHFYDGDSFIILYSYETPTSKRINHVIFIWQGRYSTKNETGSSALLAMELNDAMGGSHVQVRVTQGKEPSHFRSIFQGQMILHSGGVSSGFRKEAEDSSDKAAEDSEVRLYRVKGTDKNNVHAVAVDENASSLNSCDCLILVQDKKDTILWCGNKANEYEYYSAVVIGKKIGGENELISVQEGNESDDFWSALGGKKEYASLRPHEEVPSDPRLFKCSNALGVFSVDPIEPFTQEDLCVDSVMMLDVGTGLYIWVGSGANDDERIKSDKSALKYLAAAPDKMERFSIVKIMSGNEPLIFTQWFDNWDHEMANKTFVDPYKAKLNKKEEEVEDVVTPAADASVAVEVADDSVASREKLLSDEEFVAQLGVTKDEFYELPKWKQVKKKKEAGLF